MGGLPALTFKKILIANRGEIVRRIRATADRLGIACAGVYSDADRSSLGMWGMKEAVWIGPSAPAESYLRIDKLIDAAQRVGADAIHPGYGFLAENAGFAEACAAAGIAFIGPRPDTIRQMGSKSSGRSIAEACRVPIVPGYQGDDLAAGAEALGYPLMIKATAGGGGRGMRLVAAPSDFAAAVESAAREARAAFGDGSLILERAVMNAHHVEVQIFGDIHGRVIHLFERDCSMQRRHQKLIEECPSPAITDRMRAQLYDAAIAIGKAANYVNAGTVEFLVEPNGNFYFIEMNTRIQVEHPVTEMVTGLDLIEMQIRVAEGGSLEEFNLPSAPQGHAIEARICAEDPAHGFAPQVGRLELFEVYGDRVDDGQGRLASEVTPHYDSLLAKVVTHRDTRALAIKELIDGLQMSRILGLTTNRDYMIQILQSEQFQFGRVTTEFLPEPAKQDATNRLASARALALWLHERQIRERAILPAIGAYRNNPFRSASMRFLAQDGVIDAPVEGRLIRVNQHWVEIEADGIKRTFEIHSAGQKHHVASALGSFHFERLPRHPKPKSAGTNAAASSPMPGQVLRVLVQLGASVKIGDALVVLEAMKMEQTIKSQMDGVVSKILIKPGDVVSPGQTLVQIGA